MSKARHPTKAFFLQLEKTDQSTLFGFLNDNRMRTATNRKLQLTDGKSSNICGSKTMMEEAVVKTPKLQLELKNTMKSTEKSSLKLDFSFDFIGFSIPIVDTRKMDNCLLNIGYRIYIIVYDNTGYRSIIGFIGLH